MDPDEAANLALEVSLRSWLSTHLPAHASTLNDASVTIHEVLKSGIILCEMMNVIKAGSMKRISTINTAYKQLENVQNYLNMCRIMGMQASQLFESSDLVNGKFKSSILINLKTLQGIHERYTKSSESSASTPSTALTPSHSQSSTTTEVSSTSSYSASGVSSSSQVNIPTRSTSSTRINSTSAASRSSSISSSSAQTAPSPLSFNTDPVVRTVINTKAEDKTITLVVAWIETVLSTKKPTELTLFEWLKSGVVLLQMLNAIRPGIAKPIYEGSIGFKQIENVQRYTKLCPIVAGVGVPLFSVPDLTEERDQSSVTSHLHALITIVQRDPKWTGPTLDSMHRAPKLNSGALTSPRSSDSTTEAYEPNTSYTMTSTDSDNEIAEKIAEKPVERPPVANEPSVPVTPSQTASRVEAHEEKPKSSIGTLTKLEPHPAPTQVRSPAAEAPSTSHITVSPTPKEAPVEAFPKATEDHSGPPVTATSSATAAKPEPLPTPSSAASSNVATNSINNKTEEKTITLIVSWIEAVLSTKKPTELTLFEWLKSGVVLLQMLNAIRPGIAKPIYEGSIGFKQIENVQRYTKLCPIVAGVGVPLFSVPDLTEERDQSSVTSHLHALITIVQRDPKWTGPTLDSMHRTTKLSATGSSSPTYCQPSTTVSDSASSINTFSVTDTPDTAAGGQKHPAESPVSVPASSVDPPQSQAPPQEQLSFSHHLADSKVADHIFERTTSTLSENVEAPPIPIEPAPSSHKVLSASSSTSSTTSTASLDSTTPASTTASTSSSDLSELEKARRELEAERLAMQEEKRLFEQKMQEETERRLAEMAAKLESEAAARVADAMASERLKSMEMASQLEEEKKARAEISRKLEKERESRLRLAAESEHQRQEIATEAQKQLQAVADRLEMETSKKIEALASRITSEAMQKTEAELKKKDEHLMKQIDRERVLRSRLEALEDEKRSLTKTFDKKFAALESELKASKALSKQQSIKKTSSGNLQPPQAHHSAHTTHLAPQIQVHPPVDSEGYSSSSVDAETLQAFKSWNSKWRANRRLTKQLTRTLSQIDSTLDLSEEAGGTSPLSLITPRSDIDLTEQAEEGDEESEEEPESQLCSNFRSSTTTDAEEETEDDESDDEKSDLEKKQWLDDDWSEEEDWGSDEDEITFDDDDACEATPQLAPDGHSPSDSKRRRSHDHGKPASTKTSPSKGDEWSEFSTVKLGRYS